MSQIDDAFEDLSHALRVLGEAQWKAQGGLLQIDRAEAVGNIETGLAAVLNSFHSLYDAMGKEAGGQRVNWYKTPALATVLVLRNARHHNQAKKIRTMYTYYIQEAAKIGAMERYVLVGFPCREEGATTHEVYLSWADLKFLFTLPPEESRIQRSLALSIQEYLNSSRFKKYAEHYELEENRVFFNVVPLIVNAAATVVPLINDLITPKSTESKTFFALFQDMLLANTTEHEVDCGPIALMP